MAKRSGLGKGLNALFIDNNTDDGSVTTLKLSEVEPNRHQPRSLFDDEALGELADSIREHGVIQPLVVRPLNSGAYQIVAGERRWRAARMAGLSEIPVVIRDLDESQTLEIAIIENLQREDLNVIELAQGYKSLMEEHGMTQEQVAKKIGKSRSDVANTVRLLSLPESVMKHIRSGKISKGHAKALLSLEDKAQIEEVAHKIVLDQMLVRDIEKLAKESKEPKKATEKSEKPEKEQNPVWGTDQNFYKEMAIALSDELGRRVTITTGGKKSSIEIEFYYKEELMDIVERLNKNSW
jgi:ParB family chromosome partitioning protein